MSCALSIPDFCALHQGSSSRDLTVNCNIHGNFVWRKRSITASKRRLLLLFESFKLQVVRFVAQKGT